MSHPIATVIWNEFQGFRRACADTARPILDGLGKDLAVVETYANAEFWAGWNAAIMHAAKVAENRHSCWQESTLGSSQPCDDVSACEDIAAAIRHNLHRKPCASRPLASVDTHPKGGDAQQAPFMGSAVPQGDAPNSVPVPSGDHSNGR